MTWTDALGMRLQRKGTRTNAVALAATMALNFLSGEALDPRVTASGGVNGTRTNSAGIIGAAAAPRFDYNNIQTNFNRNSSMVGVVPGFPGTQPNFWALSTAVDGLARQIVGTSVENGIFYFDLRYFGTIAAGAVGFTINFDAAGAIPALAGQTWTNSAYLSLVAGSFANMASVQMNIRGFDSTPTLLDNLLGPDIKGTINSAPVSTQRYFTTQTLVNGATASVLGVLRLVTGSINQPVDFTLRIGLPMLQQASAPTAPIATSNAAASSGSPAGLLIEEQRTNLYTVSSDFSNAFWGKNTCVFTANQTTSPDGTVNAGTMVAGVGTAGYIIATGISHTANSTYTHSCFVKAFGRTAFTLLAQGNLFVDAVNRAWTYTLSGAGSVVNNTGTGSTATITAVGNGWYYVTLTYTPTVTIVSGVQMRDSVNGDAVNGFYLWGAQLELDGLSTLFRSTYMPTAGATVTRTGDLITLPALGASGSAYIEFMIPVLVTGSSTNNGLLEIDNNVTGFADAIYCYVLSNGGVQLGVNVGSVSQALVGTGAASVTAGTVNKVAITWSPTGISLCVNGGTVLTSAASMPATTRATVGDIANGQKLGGWMRKLSIYALPLPASTLKSITT